MLFAIILPLPTITLLLQQLQHLQLLQQQQLQVVMIVVRLHFTFVTWQPDKTDDQLFSYYGNWWWPRDKQICGVGWHQWDPDLLPLRPSLKEISPCTKWGHQLWRLWLSGQVFVPYPLQQRFLGANSQSQPGETLPQCMGFPTRYCVVWRPWQYDNYRDTYGEWRQQPQLYPQLWYPVSLLI